MGKELIPELRDQAWLGDCMAKAFDLDWFKMFMEKLKGLVVQEALRLEMPMTADELLRLNGAIAGLKQAYSLPEMLLILGEGAKTELEELNNGKKEK